MSSILATKLHRPTIPPKNVFRPFLIQRLDQGLQSGRQVTLVSAPAGFGKTVCVSAFLDVSDLPRSWLSLDAADDDPGRFFTYLLAALQKIDEGIGQDIQGILGAGQLPPGEILVSTLINDILEVEELFLLILDDFHLIQDEFILEVIQQLIANIPPALYLVIITREDPPLPLAKLRANNQLTEIRARDLRFNSQEVSTFLNQVMGLSLTEKNILALEERTEGWVVGLQLAGLALQSSSSRQSLSASKQYTNPSRFIANLSGSNRFILNYLTEEVLNQQPPDIQTFLLQTSCLEKLNDDLCNTLTGRLDSHVLLERLYNDNLFLIPLDDKQDWYRYHQLFADLLRDLQKSQHKEAAKQLHQRASRWYTQHGMASEAIHHALQAEDYTLAMQLLESYTLDMLVQWHVKTVEGWMRAIPPEWGAKSPKANLAFAWMHLLRGTYPKAMPYLERLQVIFANASLDDGTDPELIAEWLALQSTLTNAQGNPEQALELGQQALQITPEDNGHVYSMIYLGLANAYQQLDRFSKAMDAFRMLIQYGRAAANPISELLGISGLGLLAIQRGQLQYAFEITTQGIDLIERMGALSPISTAIYGELGVVHYQRHQLDQAHDYFQRSIQVSSLSGYSDAEVYYGVILVRLFQIEGNLRAARQEIRKTVQLMQENTPAAVREEVISQQLRIYLYDDQLAEAEKVLGGEGFSFHQGFSSPELPPDQQISRQKGVLYLSALRILLYRARVEGELDRLSQGIQLANQLISNSLQRHFIPIAIETLLLRAQLYAVLAKQSASRADLVNALELGEPEGFISIFVEEGPPIETALQNLIAKGTTTSTQKAYIERILAAFPIAHTSVSKTSDSSLQTADKIHPPVAALTERELEVLNCMADGMTYEEIASKLYISLNTVRTHVKSLYGKLVVNNRTRAIAQARRQGLI